MKKCSLCKELKPHNEFHKQTRAEDGHSTRCKTCVALYHIKRYKRKRPPKPQVPKDCKYCTKCTTVKKKTEFGVNKGRWDGLATKCKACAAAYGKQRRLERM